MHLSENPEEDKFLSTMNSNGDFVRGDDGFLIYWPDGYNQGAYSAWVLRAVADYLDRENESWANQIERHFDVFDTDGSTLGM